MKFTSKPFTKIARKAMLLELTRPFKGKAVSFLPAGVRSEEGQGKVRGKLEKLQLILSFPEAHLCGCLAIYGLFKERNG